VGAMDRSNANVERIGLMMGGVTLDQMANATGQHV
jgi:hypothetical protein